MKSSLVLFVIALGGPAFAQLATAPPASKTALATENMYEGILKQVYDFSQDAVIASDSSAEHVSDAGDVGRAPACDETYNSLFSKPVAKFNVTLGYADSIAGVEDFAAYTLWVERLKRRCSPTTGPTCGFVNGDPDDADVLTKEIVAPNGKKSTIRLSIVNSAVSADDGENRGLYADKQKRQSDIAKDNFFGGLATSDVSIYTGHGRRCGGPAFEPPILLPGDLRTNFAAYRKRESAARMTQALKAAATPPKLIGYFACDANCGTIDQLRGATKQKSGVIVSDGLTNQELAYAQAFAALDSVLAMRCEREFKNALASVSPLVSDKNLAPEMQGFFAPASDKPLEENAAVPRSYRSGGSLLDQPLILPAGPGKAGVVGPKKTQTSSPAAAK